MIKRIKTQVPLFALMIALLYIVKGNQQLTEPNIRIDEHGFEASMQSQ